MKTLLLETSSEKSLVALIDQDTATSFPITGGPFLSKNISLHVFSLLKEHPFSPDQILIGEGPGSITGARVGAALGKALAFGWKIPCKMFCSLKLFTPKEDGPFTIIVDAKMERFHLLRGLKKEDQLTYEPLITIPTSQLPTFFTQPSRILSPHPSLIRTVSCEEALPSNFQNLI